MGRRIKSPRRNGDSHVASRQLGWNSTVRSTGGVGIEIPAGLSQVDWKKCAIDGKSTFNNWDWGEWLVYGMDNFGKSATRDAAEEISGKAWSTLMNWIAATRGVARERRSMIAPLTFSHHLAICSYPPEIQSVLLQRCKDEELSLVDLYDLIRREYSHVMARSPKKKDEESSIGVTPDAVRVSYTPDTDRIDILWGEESDALRTTSNDHFVARIDRHGRLVGVSIYSAANLKAPITFEVSYSANDE